MGAEMTQDFAQPDAGLKQRIKQAVSEDIALTPYNPSWPDRFEEEAALLWKIIPPGLMVRIEHFGSTAVPNLIAKPIIDMLVEVASLESARKQIAPILEARSYDYFWRPEFDKPPHYAWFIKRDEAGRRTHHIHMVEKDSRLWDRLYFRDYLRAYPEKAAQYGDLKRFLAKKYPNDRIAYTRAKTDFILTVTARAKEHFAR